VYYVAVFWYIFPRFGKLCQEKSGNPAPSFPENASTSSLDISETNTASRGPAASTLADPVIVPELRPSIGGNLKWVQLGGRVTRWEVIKCCPYLFISIK
jgi:hypothetical protein